MRVHLSHEWNGPETSSGFILGNEMRLSFSLEGGGRDKWVLLLTSMAKRILSVVYGVENE
jgi:hypothetical protein